MFLRYVFPLFLFFTLLSTCSGDSPEQGAADQTATTWEFALENNPEDFRRQVFFGPGRKITLVGDSVRMNNGFLDALKVYPIYGKVRTDSTISVGLESTPLGGLEVSKYENDSLIRTAVFYPETGDNKVPHKELIGQTYRVTNKAGETFRIYFGNDPKQSNSRQVTDYFVSGDKRMESDKSFISKRRGNGWHSDAYRPKLLYDSYYFGSSHPFLLRMFTSIIRTPEGKLFVKDLVMGEERYEEERMPMERVPPIIPEDVDLTEFTDLINYGKVFVDTSYPAPDSARVSYAYADDFARFGVTLEETKDLEFNYSPLDGSFNTFANRKKLDGGKWMLSADRNNLIHMTGEGRHRSVLPILAYDGASVEFRVPLSVQTREPWGVELTSFVHVDAHVRIEKAANATK